MGKTNSESGAPAFSYGEDENPARGNWSGRMDFLLSTIGYAVGLGNIWRFPYKCYANGGASFLIPYLIFLVTAGLPMFFMEMSFGQFASLGPISIWKIMPFFKGIGWGMVIISFLVCIYYNMIIAYTLYYLFASMASTVPWQYCRAEWMRINTTNGLITCVERTTDNYTTTIADRNQWCADYKYDSIVNGTDDYLFNCTARRLTPAAIYWEREVLDMSANIEDGASDFKWQLVLSLLGAWVLIFLCMCKGIKSTGKVVYFTAIFPYVVLIILCIRNAMLPGSLKGVEYYLKPNTTRLSEPAVWYTAASQIFYSLGIAFGGLMTMSSYNRFNNNVYRDSILVACINCGTSVFGGFVIFSVIGYMSEITGLPVSEVTDSGPGLAFIAYPEGIATMPAPQLWSVLFFLMLLTVGLDSQFGMLETVLTALVDEFNLTRFRFGKTGMCAALCVVQFLLGLPQCARNGIFIMNLMEWYSSYYALFLLALIEVIAISWIYGVKNFRDDIQMMVGCGKWINASFYYYWFPMWCFITPVMLSFIFVYACIGWGPITYNGIAYPKFADDLGFLMTALALAPLPIVGMIEFCKALQVAPKLFKPRCDWGPALQQHRTGSKYENSYNNNAYQEEDDSNMVNTEKGMPSVSSGKYKNSYPVMEVGNTQL